MNNVRLGIVGIGRVGTNHSRISTDLRDTEIIGFCDIIKERADLTAELHGKKAFYDYKELCNLVDAVIISTQTEFHYEIAKYFLENNKHVLIEKPICILEEEAKELINLADKNNLVLSVGHVERHNSVIVELEDLFNPSEVIAISTKRMSPMDYRVKDIDVVMDLMIHDIDIVLSLMRGVNISRISASGTCVKDISREQRFVDYAVAQIAFDNNVIADLTASRVTEKKIRTLSVNGLDNFMEIDYLNKDLTIHRNFTATHGQISEKNHSTKYQQQSIIQKVYVNNTDSLFQEQQNFINAINKKERIKVSGIDGLNALIVAKKIQNDIYSNINM